MAQDLEQKFSLVRFANTVLLTLVMGAGAALFYETYSDNKRREQLEQMERERTRAKCQNQDLIRDFYYKLKHREKRDKKWQEMYEKMSEDHRIKKNLEYLERIYQQEEKQKREEPQREYNDKVKHC